MLEWTTANSVRVPIRLLLTILCAVMLTGAGESASLTPHTAAGHVTSADKGWVEAGESSRAPPAARLFGTSERQTTAGLVLAIGDLLEITFFEQHGREAGNVSMGQAVLSNLVERLDLTGKYTVQADGTIFLPFFDTLVAADRTQKALLQTIEAEFSRLAEGPVKVVLRVIDRQPVYVTGHVPQAGVFKHTPGMTVLHAMALAGASEAGAGSDWKTLDLTREKERLQKAEGRLIRLLASVEVLRAEREDRAATPSRRLIQLAGERRALELVAEAEALRTLELERSKAAETGLTAVLAAFENEQAVLRESLKQAGETVRDLGRRFQAVSALRDQKMTTDLTFYTARSELSLAREHWNEMKAAIARAERTSAEIRQQKKQLSIDAHIERDKLIKETQEAIAEEEVTAATLGQLLRGMSGTRTAPMDLQNRMQFKILRQLPSGLKQLDADEFSPLQPGDVLHASVMAARTH